ncbi:MAG: hypothetical protein IJV67_07095 [Clostridia bacterium]|nr:hypothetical protein [Clostridia bacterium]
MKKKLLILLSVLTLVCCALFGVSVVGFAGEETQENREGALVIATTYPQDGMINCLTQVSGAMDISMDVDVSALKNFGFGLMSTYGDNSPYKSNLIFASKTSAFTPWGKKLLSSTAYLNGFKISGRTTLKLSVNENGDATVYAGNDQILPTISGLYADEIKGGYFCMFARAGTGNGYVYSVKINSANGDKLCWMDFNYDILNTDNFYFGPATVVNNISWQSPLGDYVPGALATLDVSGVKTVYTEGDVADLTPVVVNKKETDVLTVKVNGTAITDYNYKFETVGEYTVEYVVVNGAGEELDKATVTVTVEKLKETEGALVFTSTAGNDGMVNHKVQVFGAMDIYVDIDFGGIAQYGVGLMTNVGDTSPYSATTNMFMLSKSTIWAPWGSKLLPSATAYNDGYTINGRTTIRINVTESGDVTFYDGDVKLYDTFEGLYANEVKGSYFCMFVRAGTDNGYVYTVKINDANGVKLDRIDFAYDILNTDHFVFTEAILNGLGTKVYRQPATGVFVPTATAKLDVSGVKTVVTEGEKVDLTPTVTDKAEDDKLTVKVNGEVITDYNYVFTAPGTYTVAYFVTDKDGKDLDSGSIKVTVNALLAQLDVSGVVTACKSGEKVDLTPEVGNKKETDVLTVKVNGEEITEYIYTFETAGEYTVEYVIVDANGEMLDSKTVSITVTDAEGALVFVPGYAQDGVINNKVKISGAMSIDIDIDFTTFKNFGFGIMSTYGDSSPYNSNLLFASKTGAFTPWGDKLVSEANAKYIDGYVIEGRVILTLDISADGDATLYANGVKIKDTIEGLYADEVNGGYFCMFARIGSEKAYLYSVVIKDVNGNKLHKLDFRYDILNTEDFFFTSSVQAGLGKVLYWQQPSGKYVPAPTAEISVSSVATSVNHNSKIDLTPIITNMAETDVLTVTVDGNVIEDLEYTFTETGYHTVEYIVVNAEGEELDKATVKIFVKANSTQNNAETNFNQGYFDGREFEATNGVAVKDNALYFKSEGTALFTTAGYSENFIITFDITSYVAGEVKAVFGCIDENEYAFTFLANGNVEFGGVEYEVGKNIYEVLAAGNKVTVRVKVFGGNASLFVRFSNESVENIEIALVTVKEINVVGKVGFGGENAEFTADNVKFVSLTSVDEDNTYYPSDEELNPDTGDDEPEDTSSTQSSASEGKKGCKSSMSMGSLLSVAALLGAVILKKKEN